MTARGTSRTRFIEHAGRKILLLDFAGIEDAQTALDAISEARAAVATQPADGSPFESLDAAKTYLVAQ